MAVKITARPNGPYLVEGDVELYDPAGNKVDTTGKPRIALCRCGASRTKPFCDGTHSHRWRLRTAGWPSTQAANSTGPHRRSRAPGRLRGKRDVVHDGRPWPARTSGRRPSQAQPLPGSACGAWVITSPGVISRVP